MEMCLFCVRGGEKNTWRKYIFDVQKEYNNGNLFSWCTFFNPSYNTKTCFQSIVLTIKMYLR